MINEQYKAMLQGKSVIRQLSEFATERGKEIGYENVFDYSLGNPSVPVPSEFNEGIKEMVDTMSSMELHGYSPSVGIASVKDAIAKSLNERFGMNYTGNHIFPTSGAAGAIAHAVRCVTKPGDEVLTFAPYFPEYNPYINTSGAVLKVVPANTVDFQINFEELDKMFNENVAALLINTPNNPSGVVYSKETLTKLADYLYKKQEEYGHDIFILSDEPYREIVFDGVDAPYVSKFYDNTLSCYSYSKSISLPGERIGYVAANPKCTDAELISVICSQISRGIGHNCPSSMMQYGVARVLDKTSDMSIYEKNMNLLYNELTSLGFEVVKPGGTFYIFPKALEDDAVAFCNKAKDYDLILVPSDSFGVKGYFRMAYCIDTEKVERSLPALRKFVKECYGR
ncbi:MAG: pyridoxal phosphate-dependent aminotransferase [Lachnospiraceae bacterium]|nr:pyridoxal phosphate-dependent aminotransferase [Lachnospiraceae bacterium]